MKIEVSLDGKNPENKIVVVTKKLNDQIKDLVYQISVVVNGTINCYSQKGVEMINLKDIIRIYSANQKVYAQTGDGTYMLHNRLYELEEQLDDNIYVRISNSEIVNKRKIKRFDVSLTGTIGVYLDNNIETYASRRYVSKLKKIFGI